MISLTCGIFSTKIQMNLFTKQKQTDMENRLVVAKEEGGGGERMDWEFGISRCKLLYIEWINNIPTV